MLSEQQMQFLCEHTITSKFTIGLDGRRWWTVFAFHGFGSGPTFETALDAAMERARHNGAELAGKEVAP